MKTTKIPELHPADLEGLMNSCRRNGRPARLPTKQPKIYFDADRFRWLFTHGFKTPNLVEDMLAGASQRRNMDDWRLWVDWYIREWEARQ